jgi:hypothetical protein
VIFAMITLGLAMVAAAIAIPRRYERAEADLGQVSEVTPVTLRG